MGSLKFKSYSCKIGSKLISPHRFRYLSCILCVGVTLGIIIISYVLSVPEKLDNIVKLLKNTIFHIAMCNSILYIIAI